MREIDRYLSQAASPEPHVLLSRLTDAEFARVYGVILGIARDEGFRGFGGDCWSAALAINAVIFGGKGVYVAGLNAPLFGKKIAVGHAAVKLRGACWDADGKPKEIDEIESWGMLDPEDSDYKKLFRRHKLTWNDETAGDAGVWEFDTEAEFIRATPADRFEAEDMADILRDALTIWQERRA